MLNVETIEKLAKIKGENLVSLYLNTDKRRFSQVSIKTKVKDLLKNIELPEREKSEISQKVLDFLGKISLNTKSTAIFVSKSFWYPFVFAQDMDDSITSDTFFNLKPLLFLLSENKSMGVLLLDSERARFFSIFLGELEEHRHFEDQIVRRSDQGGWSQERFEHKREEIIKKHLSRALDFLIKMYKIHKFEYLLLKNDPELEHEFIKILPEELKKKLKGEIKVDIRAPSEEVVKKAMEVEEKEVEKEERDLAREISDLLTRESGRARVVSGLIPVINELYDKRISLLLVNEGFSESGTYCKFCGYISLTGNFCPYDQTPTTRERDVISLIVKEAINQKADVKILKDDKTLKELGNIAAFLKEH